MHNLSAYCEADHADLDSRMYKNLSKRKGSRNMTEQDKRNVRELFSSLVQTYELLNENEAERYIEYNVGQSTKQYIRGLIEDLMRDFPSCSLRVKHKCWLHDYGGDSRCAICGNIIDYDLD